MSNHKNGKTVIYKDFVNVSFVTAENQSFSRLSSTNTLSVIDGGLKYPFPHLLSVLIKKIQSIFVRDYEMKTCENKELTIKHQTYFLK